MYQPQEETRMGFWQQTQNGTFDGSGGSSRDIVLDTNRHRQLANTGLDSSGGNGGMGGLSGRSGMNNSFDNMMRAMDGNRSPQRAAPTDRGLSFGQQGQMQPTSQQVGLSNFQLAQGSGMSNLPLDAAPNSALHPLKTMAEMSERRTEAIKAAYRRVDPRGLGYTSQDELARALQQYTNLPSDQQQRVLHGIAGNSPQRISFAQFSAYYQLLGSNVERDRDFEDMIRHHWGFPEVCDILDDMKNKFMMVGLAYTFRRGLDQGIPELSEQAFAQAVNQVGMTYSQTDVRRVFNAFETSPGQSPCPTLEVLKLTAHLTSAPKPPTPHPALYGTAHFSEVNSQADNYSVGMPGTPGNYSAHFASGSGGGFGMKLPEAPPDAPPENPEMGENESREIVPEAPKEEDEDGVLAPAERGGNIYEPPPEAPPEDDDGEIAPKERNLPDADDDVVAPREGASGPSGPSSFGSPGKQRYNMAYSAPGKPGYLQAVAAAGNSVPKGRQRAVTVGINYINTRNELSGCINDSDTFVKMLTGDFGYQVSDIRQLRDDHPQRMPTRKNITASLKWLVNGAQPGDHLFFHYSGHGSQQADTNGDERGGKDDTLVPCDFQDAGMMVDDDLRAMLVLPLAQGVRLTVIMDCCHSGSALDLPYTVKMDLDGESATLKKKAGYRTRKADADVVMISGCMDTQTSADIGAGSAGNTKAAGAMTTAFKTVMLQDATLSYADVVKEMRKFLKGRGFKQVPQLSSERFLNLSECFMPEVDCPDDEPTPASTRPPNRKALTIGINYLTLAPGRGRLSGCINDSETMVGIMKDTFGFQDGQISRLRDDRANMMPTKDNILKQMRWLTQSAQSGDELFLHYSGHGGQQKDTNGDEKDGKDDTILPCDFQTAGQITDDDLHSLLVDSLPKGVRLWVIMDCCHSGTCLDLRYKITMSADGSISCKDNRARGVQRPKPKGEVIMISGCKDTQTSADIGSGSLGVAKAAGAMTTAFRHTINNSISCEDLLQSMRSYLKRNSFDQVPQMSSDTSVQLDVSFVHYQERKRNKRELPPSLASRGLSAPASPMMPVSPLMSVSPMMPRSPMMAGAGMGGSPMGGAMGMGGMAPAYPMSPQGMSRGDEDAGVLGDRLVRLEQDLQQLRASSQSPQQQGGSPLMGPPPTGYAGSPMGNHQGGWGQY